MATEVEFARKYTSLIREACPDVVQDTRLAELSIIPKVGFIKLTSLPAYKRQTDSNDDKEISVTFRSIRAPKFKKTLCIKADWLIHKVKRVLQESLKEDKLAVDIEQIKLMLKTKTVHDGSRLSSLLKTPSDDNVTLNVFITKMSAAEKAVNDAANTEIPEMASAKEGAADYSDEVLNTINDDKVALSEETWKKIGTILKSEITDDQLREKYLNALKNVEL